MLNRTMSFLSLALIATAGLLVAGCAPIDNSDEQVRAAEAERIRKLEQDVAAVAGKADQAVRVAQAVQAEAVQADQAAIVTANPKEWIKTMAQVLEEDTELQRLVIDSLCNNAVTLQLIDVDKGFIDAIHANEELERLGLKPELQAKNKGTYEYEYPNLSRPQFDAIRTQIGREANKANGRQVVLDEKEARIRCEPLKEQKGDLVYVSVSGETVGDTERNYTLSIQLRFVNPYDGSKVWFVPQKGHWLSKATRYIENPNERNKIARIFAASDGVEITGKGFAGGQWSGNTWTWKVSSNLVMGPGMTPAALIQDNPKVVYAMVARKTRRKVAGQLRTFRVVQYRKFEVTSPTGTFSDQPIELANVLAQPACPPSSESKMDTSAQESFRRILAGFYGAPCMSP